MRLKARRRDRVRYCGGRGRALRHELWVKPRDVQKAARVLGVL